MTGARRLAAFFVVAMLLPWGSAEATACEQWQRYCPHYPVNPASLFDLSHARPTDRQKFQHLLHECDQFDWNVLAEGLHGQQIVVRSAGLRPDIFRFPPPRIRSWAGRVFLHEVGHMADVYGMTNAERAAVFAAYHGGEQAVSFVVWEGHFFPDHEGHGWLVGPNRTNTGEAFADLFVRLFCGGGYVGYPEAAHQNTAQVAAEVRQILARWFVP